MAEVAAIRRDPRLVLVKCRRVVIEVPGIGCGWQAPRNDAGRQRAVRHRTNVLPCLFCRRLAQVYFFINGKFSQGHFFAAFRGSPDASAGSPLLRFRGFSGPARSRISARHQTPGAPERPPGAPTGQSTRSEDGMSKQTTDTDVAFISALAELLNKNDLTELSVKREYGEDDSLEVRVVKQATIVTVAAAPAPAPVITTRRLRPACRRPAAAPLPSNEDPGPAPRCRDLAHGRHRLSCCRAGCHALCGRRRPSDRGPDRPHHRGDEDDEPHSRSARRAR